MARSMRQDWIEALARLKKLANGRPSTLMAQQWASGMSEGSKYNTLYYKAYIEEIGYGDASSTAVGAIEQLLITEAENAKGSQGSDVS